MNEISINWTMAEPPVTPVGWRIWNLEHFPENLRRDSGFELKNAAQIFSDPTVQEVLVTAFRERLPRSTGWEAGKDLPDFISARIAAAASVFKRGVAFRRTGDRHSTVLKQGSYPVRVLNQSEAQEACTPQLASDHFVIVDAKVYAAHKSFFAACKDPYVMSIDEHGKQPTAVTTLLTAWEKQGKRTRWSIFGGGIVTDTAAFAASLAECACTFIPTTLLAMADACVGGKTGVNFSPFGKNLLGHFYFPNAVLVWPGWLTSLDRRQINAGAFECIKHFILQQDLETAKAFADATATLDLSFMAKTLPSIIQIKADVVSQDPAETGKRAILNFGHTLGHAVEALSQKLTTGQQTILHGEAVGIGMAFATFLSTKVTGLPADIENSIQTALKATGGLPGKSHLTRFFADKDPRTDEVISALADFIAQDKKSRQDSKFNDWVLLGNDGGINQPQGTCWSTPVATETFPDYWRLWLAGQT